MNLQPVPIVGGCYADDTRPYSAQDCVNWIPERAEVQGGRSDGILRSAPGLSLFSDEPFFDPYAANVISFMRMETDAYDDIAATNWTSSVSSYPATGPFGNTCASFAGGERMFRTIGASALFAGEFTVDVFHKQDLGSTSDFVLVLGTIILEIDASGNLLYKCGATTITQTGYTTDTWRHIQMCRDASNNVYAFSNGVLIGTAVRSGSVGTTGGVYWGANISSGYLNGDLCYGRVTAGVCRNTTTFTPPTAPYGY